MKMKTDDRIGYAHADKLLLPNNLLLRELEEMLADERTVMLKTKGDSMLPFIVGGRDSVLIRRPSGIKSLQTGRIVLAHLPDSRYVLHRIVRIRGTEVILMGDGNCRETESCPLSDIKGIVTKSSEMAVMWTAIQELNGIRQKYGAHCSPSADIYYTYTDGYGYNG